MNVLIVEDDETMLTFFADEVKKIDGVTATFAKSRDGAVGLLSDNAFDLIILDLKIPTVDGALDADQSHGLAVRAAIEEKTVGTPVIIFSSFGTLKLVNKLLSESEKHDVFGSGAPLSMTLFKEKSELQECLDSIRVAAKECAILDDIEISFGTTPLDLNHNERRVLRIFARLIGGKHVRVAALGGGLSGARTCRIEVQDGNSVTSCYAVVKLAGVRELDREFHAHKRYVSPAIKIAGFPHVVGFVRAGAANVGGLYYSLAAEHSISLLDALKTAPETTGNIVTLLKELEVIWQKGARVEMIAVGDLRREFICDADFMPHAANLPFDWQKLEKISVRVNRCCRHGDLHGLNVLLKNGTEPLLIDFASVTLAPASLDPLILELSLLFHPACRGACGSWPTVEQAARWDNLDFFTDGSPLAAYVRRCRQWAVEAEAGDKGMFATVYGFAVRQLKFRDGNHELALAVAACSARRIFAA